jgi:formate-dependent nitrite reductase membrane component NrfD
MHPFGIQVVLYLFLSGVAAGSAFAGSLSLTGGRADAARDARRGLWIAFAAASLGALCLILDLARPKDFLLILTQANTASAISWGARILLIFALIALYIAIAIRGWAEVEARRGLGGIDLACLWLLRVAAIALSIYPAFVLRQGDAFPLWQGTLLIPLLAVSAFHAGTAAFRLASTAEDVPLGTRGVEIGLGLSQILLALGLIAASGRLEEVGEPITFWLLTIAVGSALPLLLVLVRPRSEVALRLGLVLLGTFTLRYWLVSAGQSVV